MTATKACREVAAAMPDDELVTALTVLGPDSPLAPAVRAEVRRRLEAANTAATARPVRVCELSSPEAADIVLGALLELATGGVAVASIRELASRTGLGRSTANRALDRLVKGGRIDAVRKGTGDGFPTTWRITQTSTTEPRKEPA